MTSPLTFNNRQHISSSDAARATGYTNDHISRLARQGKVDARRVGRTWYVSEDSLNAFVAKQQEERETRNQTVAETRKRELAAGEILRTEQPQKSTAAETPEEEVAQSDTVAASPQVSPRVPHATAASDYIRTPLRKMSHAAYARAANVVASDVFQKASALALSVLVVASGYAFATSPFVHAMPGHVSRAVTAVADFDVYDAVVATAHNVQSFSADAATPLVEAFGYTMLSGYDIAFGSDAERAAALSRVRHAPRMAWHGMSGSVAAVVDMLGQPVTNGLVYTQQANVFDATGQTFIRARDAILGFFRTETPDEIDTELSQEEYRTVRDRLLGRNRLVEGGSETDVSDSETEAETEPTTPPQTVVRRPVIERITERVVVQSGISESELVGRLSALHESLQVQIANSTAQNATQIVNNYTNISKTNKIDQLNDIDLSDSTITNSSIGGTTGSFSQSLSVANNLSVSGTISAGGGLSVGGSGTTTFSDSITVDDDTFVVNAGTDRVGIGTSSPFAPLSVVGNIAGGSIQTTDGSATSTFAGSVHVSGTPNGTHSFPSWSIGATDANPLGASLIVNPESAGADTNLISATVGTSTKFLVDAEGDVFANTLTLAGSSSLATTSISTLTVEGNTILGDATTTDTTYFNSRIGTSLIPTSDNTLDIGSITDWLKWRSGYFADRVVIGDGTATTTIRNGSATSTFEGAVDLLGLTTFGSGFVSQASSTAAGGLTIAGGATTTGKTILARDSGNVGIGTTSPSQRLSVSGNGYFTGTIFASNFDASGGSLTTSLSEGSVAFATSSGELSEDTLNFVWDDANNRLGLGTNNPNYTLQVAGSGQFSGLLDASYLVATSSSATSTLAGGLNVGSGGLLYDFTTGNVGIGTTSPGVALAVDGSGYFTNGLGVGVATTTPGVIETSGDVTVGGALTVQGSLTSSVTNGQISFLATPQGTNIDEGTVYINPLSAGINNVLLGFAVNGSEVARIDAEGDVQITGLFNSTQTSGINQLSGSLQVDNDVTLGSSDADTITFNGQFGSSIIPDTDTTYDLGSPSNRFANFYVATTTVDSLVAGGTASSTFIINEGNSTADTQDSSLQFERGSLTPNAILKWDSANDRFDFNDFPVHLQNALIVDGTASSSIAGPLWVTGQSQGTDLQDASLYINPGSGAADFKLFSIGVAGNERFSVDAEGDTRIQASLGIENQLFDITQDTLTINDSLKITGEEIVDSGDTTRISIGTTNTITGNLTTTGNFIAQGAGPHYFQSGDVGIGFVSPSTKLEVDGTASSTGLVVSDTVQFSNITSGALVTDSSGNVSASSTLSSSQIEDAYLFNSGDTTTGNLVFEDNVKALFGTGSDASIYYDGTDFQFDSQEVGTGNFIFNNGNVGIGTTSPFAQLSVEGQGGDAFVVSDTSNNTDFIVDGSGQVGIGTGSPSFALDVVGEGSFSATSTASYFAASTLGAVSSPAFTFTGDTDTGVWSRAADTLSFSTAGNDRLTVDSSGRVGVGTTSPQNTLDVSGSASIGSNFSTAAPTNGLIIEGDVGIGTSTPWKKLSVSETVSDAQFSIAYNDTRFANFQVNSIGDLIIDPQGRDVFLNDDNAWVCSGGSCPTGEPSNTGNLIVENKVGIGTSSPDQKLQVHDGIVKLSQSAASDNIIRFEENNTTSYNIGSDGSDFHIAGSSFTTDERLTIGSSGSVGIGTTTPALAAAGALSVSDNVYIGAGGAPALGTATSTFEGDIIIHGKLDVGTIDPVYTISGVKYATYGHSTIGIKEETTANFQIREYNAETGYYEHRIAFTELERGSDLWLFYQVTSFGSFGTWNDLVVNLTPSFDGRVFYEKDPATSTLVIKSTKPGEVSARLVADRFDASKWPNLRPDQDGGYQGHIIEEK